MKCPICTCELYEEKSELFPDYPSYRCPDVTDVDYLGETHYIKYFSADWSYTRYEEQATVHPYRVINYHNYRKGKKDTGVLQRYGKIKVPFMKSHITNVGYSNVLVLETVISIPSRDKFLQKMKTLILLS